MPLHPEVLALPDISVPLDAASLPQLRRRTLEDTPVEAGPGVPVAQVSDADANGVPVRVYVPDPSRRLPVVVYAHGGGWVEGGLDTHDPLCRLLAAMSGTAVVSVDYRLAPEHPWPAASDDIDTVIDWIRGRRAGEPIDPERLAVCGDSSGGHLAAVAARRCRDRGIPVVAQALFYPAIDPTGSTWDVQANPGLKQDNMRWCWDAFLPAGVDRRHPDVCPAAGDLTGLPSTLVVTAEFDILTPEAEAYAAAIAQAGGSAVTFQARGQIHGFVRRVARFSAAASAVGIAASFLAAQASRHADSAHLR